MLVESSHNPVRNLKRFAVPMAFSLAVLALVLVALPTAQASSLSISPSIIPQGETTQITATPTNTFSDELLQVTTPAGCVYTHPLIGPGSAIAYPTSGQWSLASGPSGCPANANTMQSNDNVQDSPEYIVKVVQSQGGLGTDVSGQKSFEVDMTDARLYERTQMMSVRSIGWGASEAVNVQIDRPGGTPFKTIQTAADGDGVVTAAFRFPQGLPGDADLGTWHVRVISQSPGSSGMVGGRDVQSVGLDRTQIIASWSKQPVDTLRMNTTGAVLDFYYAGSSIGQADPALYQRVTSGDVPGGLLDVDVQNYVGGQWQDIARGTASFNQNSHRWVVNWFPDAQFDTAQTYRLNTVAGEDQFKNEMSAAPSETFEVNPAIVTPVWEVVSTEVERASAVKPLDASVELKYTNGQPLAPADLGGEPLKVAVYKAGGRIANSDRVGTYQGGKWVFEGVTLPANIPLGQANLRILSPLTLAVPANSGADNTIAADLGSAEFTVLKTKPVVLLNSFNKTADPASAFLRGEHINFVVDASYGAGQKIRQDDVFAPGGVGRALLRVVPNENPDDIFELDLHFNSATETWQHTYQIKSDDTAGKWRVAALMSDQWGNNNVVEKTLSVGMTVTASLSSAEIQRGEDITVSATMSLPGQLGAQTGSANVTIKDAAGVIVIDDAPLAPTSTGGFEGTFTIPVDSPLGAYTAVVKGVASKDSGLDTKVFTVASTGLGVRDAALGATSVPRLGDSTFGFTISFPNGARLGPDDITPTVIVIDAAGAAVETLTASHDADSGLWSATYGPTLSTPLGTYRFQVSGEDVSGNALEATNSAAFTVSPAEIAVSELETGRTQYERGDSIRITAFANYANAPEVELPNATIPVTIRAGDLDLATIELVFNTTLDKYAGTFRIPLDAPLSSPTKPYTLLVKSDAMVDEAGNQGPVFSTPGEGPFSVAPAVLSVQITEQPTGSFTAGKDALSMKFRLLSADGTPVLGPINGLDVQVLRGKGQVANASVTSSDDIFTATFPIPKTVIAGTDYTMLITGTDAEGNLIHDTASESFLVLGVSDKGAPGPALPLLLVGLLILVRRRR